MGRVRSATQSLQAEVERSAAMIVRPTASCAGPHPIAARAAEAEQAPKLGEHIERAVRASAYARLDTLVVPLSALRGIPLLSALLSAGRRERGKLTREGTSDRLPYVAAQHLCLFAFGRSRCARGVIRSTIHTDHCH